MNKSTFEGVGGTDFVGRYICRVICLVVFVFAASSASAQSDNDEPQEGQASGAAESTDSEPSSADDSAVRLTPPGDKKDADAKEETEADESDSEGKNKESEQGSKNAVKIPEVEVIGRSPKEVESVPGSASVVSEDQLESQKPLNTNEALRMLPGVHVNPEEGMGLRQNIGIRGLNPTRSRKVHVMEDGVPIALGPYGEPEMYYSPPVERMARLEVVKGSGAILYGPQTIGGVVNYITPQPPEDFTVKTEARAGTYGYYQGEMTVGNTNGDVGYWLKGIHQRFEGPRDLNLQMTDVTSKFRLDLGPTQTLSLKFNVYDEWSRSTYLGLTTPQYQENPRANYAKHDRFKIRRYGVQATHQYVPDSDFMLETRLYGHNIQRNWRRQDFDRTDSCDKQDCYVRVIDGRGRNIVDSSSEWPSDQSGVFFRDSTGNRNREFTVAGLEPRATINWELGGFKNELQAGVRGHVEHTRERRLNGNHATSPAGTLRDDDERVGRAVAAYALNRIKLLDEKLELSPGLRFESLWTERTTYKTRVDGEPTDLDPPGAETDHVSALIPGAGFSFELTKPMSLFGGVHRGFAPPRTKDAITKEGERLDLEAEFSWNYELGARIRKGDWLKGELAGFVLDFNNQIIAPAEAGGAVSVDPEKQDPGSLKAVQGGETIHKGVEAAGTFDPGSFWQMGFGLPISFSYTFVDARFQSGWQRAIRGNQLPYAPRHRAAARIGFQHPSGLNLQLDGNWTSGQFTDKAETVRSEPAGLIGWIDSRLIVDANVSYEYEPWQMSAFVAGKNLLNKKYISSRAPRGIKPGTPRHIYGGIKLDL